MLSFTATNDKGLLDRLSEEIFLKKFPAEVGFVLCEDDEPIGVARINILPTVSVIELVGVIGAFRKKGYGDFFTRSLMNALSNVSEVIEIGYESDYYLKFGFERGGKGMKIDSRNLVFPSKCGKR